LEVVLAEIGVTKHREPRTIRRSALFSFAHWP
jgi:hypothetical protein